MHMDNEKSNVICGPDEPNNDAVQRYRLRPNRCPPCLEKLRTCQSGTRATDRHQSHRCNTTWPWALDPPRAEWLPECVSTQLPSLKCNEFYDLPLSKCRSCFFITDKTEDCVHPCHEGFTLRWILIKTRPLWHSQVRVASKRTYNQSQRDWANYLLGLILYQFLASNLYKELPRAAYIVYTGISFANA